MALERALQSAAQGDFGVRLPARRDDAIGRLEGAFNELAGRNAALEAELVRVARIIGREGRMTERASIAKAEGGWGNAIGSVNGLIDDLVRPTTEVARVIVAVAEGDLSQKMALEIEGRPVKGEFARIGATVNSMVDQLSSFADEVTRVAREVGTEGKLGGQAEVPGVAGTWKDLTDSVNFMASNLTDQVRNIAQVTTAVANGDLSQEITVDVKGEILELKDTINTMVDQLRSFAAEVTRVAREVGTEGILGGQAEVPGVAGTWKDLTDNVNFMASNLTEQVRNIATVTTAVANGDLSRKITVDARGEILELKSTVNTMVDQLSAFADQVTRVAREVGTEGILGGQAEVPGVAGTWKDLTDNVNFMASNLTEQVRNIAGVTTAVANGDLSRKITVDARGEILELKSTVNTMVDQLSAFADQVTRVAREVGTEGILGGQAEVPGVAGTWKDLTDNVNFMARNLTEQVRNIATVTTAVANGDLSRKITVDVKGEVLELKRTVNTMVDQLSAFADEVTRVAREVGTEGKLGGQAEVAGVSGTWRDLTDSVNFMASNLTDQVRNVAQVTTAVAQGDLSKKITVDARGEILQLKDTINTMVDQLRSFAAEVTRVAREVGTEGMLGGQAEVADVSGTWEGLTENVNLMASNLTTQVRSIATVTTAVANGDLSRKIDVDAKGEVAALAETINRMVDQLRSFAAEVTRVAREVGTEGILGGQAQVPGVAGTWKDLTDNVNFMARNLTDQVRNIAQVATAVANGDLTQTITVDARGEILELKQTLNRMVAQLSSFAAEVTRVAREVGTEGKLGGQAEVEGVSGTWRRLTENVNQLAGNLTTQVRAIAEVSTAVTQGDLTPSITVEAQGEVAELKDNINQMIANLRETTQRNAEQDWLKTNLAAISGTLQGQRDLAAVTQLIISEVTPTVSAEHGAFFLAEPVADGEAELVLAASYGLARRAGEGRERVLIGEGLVGQAAFERKTIALTDLPSGYIKVASGLGDAPAAGLLVMPVLFEDQVLGVIELASLRPFSDVNRDFLDRLTETIGVVINTIQANMRTEELLTQSQSLTQELQKQSEELRQTNDELQEKARLLSEQNRDIEIKNEEIELARRGLEDKASQLALSSKYKSEFLANMSHELRTPLNSMLILSRMLAGNEDGSLSEQHVEFARTINAAGSDLLSLINDILDLSKVEAGRMELELNSVALTEIAEDADRAFRQVAEEKGLAFRVEVESGLPASVVSDRQRIGQVLKNLLSNAFKFTHQGDVALTIGRAPADTLFERESLRDSGELVLCFTVADSGVGIAEDKLDAIFEAFQQADGTTSRKYGGTGLGLSISREIARLLGGEIHVESIVDRGSRFSLFVPLVERTLELPSNGRSTAVPARGVERFLGPTEPEADELGEPESNGRVMIVIDASPEHAAALSVALDGRGTHSVLVSQPGTALARVREQRPEAVVVSGEAPLVELMLRQLKKHPDTRHVPVIVAADPSVRVGVLRMGAASHLEEPVDESQLDEAVLLAERLAGTGARQVAVAPAGGELDGHTSSLLRQIAGQELEQIDGADPLAALREREFDLTVIVGGRHSSQTLALVREVATDSRLSERPLLALVPEGLSKADRARLEAAAKSAVITVVDSPEQLVDRAALHLHRAEARLPGPARKMLDQLRRGDGALQGKKVLVIDDDIRNVFALTSTLEQRGMKVVFAENGREGLERLGQHPNTDLVLLDIMMPEMDGYETAQAIRSTPRFEHLPIISLTAKAMKGDREKALAAGASDYITKPVDIGRLMSMMRVWLDA
ncbi:MAG TPA: HAMP domain-containing protein [Solirubrobacteraceae bacterium]|nr:HAMP domain-containing protein [Solirubrobacteraceae bacterium]